MVAVIHSALPLHLCKARLQVRILYQQIVQGSQGTHAGNGGKVSHVLHHVQQLKLIAGVQHEVKLFRIGIPRNTLYGNLNAHTVGLQLFIDRGDPLVICVGQRSGLHDAHGMDLPVVSSGNRSGFRLALRRAGWGAGGRRASLGVLTAAARESSEHQYRGQQQGGNSF